MRRSAALALPALVALAACRPAGPEAQVRAAFETCRKAVEAGDAAGATELLDPAFRGPEDMDRGAARLFLMGVFRREKVGVTVLRNDVAVRGGEARQEVELVLTGGSGGLLPRDASRRIFQLRWRKSGGDWRLVSLEGDAST
ncbi:hypothetical protein [Geothrix sp. 21YS21S-4]|uniref:hypothetical protein n=1 Tax=Geothrix sp. 21YS21S-4 TaxID=3068889 RepID=UPI0027B9F66A|nr:hypothetical protein [Geothrix sp. 21YS21S-4]